jgi:hypothetical protein
MGANFFLLVPYFLPTDDYIKQRVIFSDSAKRYGTDTYFGRKFFYKTQSGARIVANVPFYPQAKTLWQLMTPLRSRGLERLAPCSTNL